MRTAFFAAMLSVAVSPALANPECHYKPMLEAFLKQEHDMKLHAWGINGAGSMIELWLAPDGLFAVVTTTPRKCSTVEIPADLHGRLWAAPSPNRVVPEARNLDRGQGL